MTPVDFRRHKHYGTTHLHVYDVNSVLFFVQCLSINYKVESAHNQGINIMESIRIETKTSNYTSYQLTDEAGQLCNFTVVTANNRLTGTKSIR